MSGAYLASQAKKSRWDKGKDNTNLETYESARQVINKQIEALKKELNRTEIEWLNLCNLTQQTKTAPEIKPAEPAFKDAAELNALPLPVELEASHDPILTLQCDDEDKESSDDE